MKFINDKQRKAVFASMGRNQFTLIGSPGTWVSRGSHERTTRAVKEAAKEAAKTLKDYFPTSTKSKAWSEAKKRAYAARKAMQAGDYGAAGFSSAMTRRKGTDEIIRAWEKGKGWKKAGIFAPLGSDEATAPYFTPDAVKAWRIGTITSPIKHAPMWQQIWADKRKQFGGEQLRSLIRAGGLPSTVQYPTRIFEHIKGLKPEGLGLGKKDLESFTKELGGRSMTEWFQDISGLTPAQVKTQLAKLEAGDIGLAEAALTSPYTDDATKASVRGFLQETTSGMAPVGEYTPTQQAALSALTVETVEKEHRLPNKYEIEAALQRIDRDAMIASNIAAGLVEKPVQRMNMEQLFGGFKGVGMDPNVALGMVGAPFGTELLIQQAAAAEELATGKAIDMPDQWRPGTDWMKNLLQSKGPSGPVPFLKGGSAYFRDPGSVYGPSSGFDELAKGAPVSTGVPGGIPAESSLSPWIIPVAAGAGGLMLAGAVGKSRHVKRKPKEKEEDKK